VVLHPDGNRIELYSQEKKNADFMSHVQRPLLRSADELCDSFYHMKDTPEAGVQQLCLRHPSNGCCKGKTTCLVAQLLSADGTERYLSIYRNQAQQSCAEGFLLRDRALIEAAHGSRELRIYLTQQPCHYSSSNDSNSCTENLLRWWQRDVQPCGVSRMHIAAAYPYRAHWDAAHMSNDDLFHLGKRKWGGGGGGGGSGGGGARALALQEEQVNRLGELLMETLEETATMIEKKQARTYDEIERDLALAAEEEAMQVDEDEDEEEEEKPIYNPLNLPLGFDGKPIPYWLYKLHGLNLEFKCEICGNYSYWGPRPFERHFQEWRHSYGMKCLGIPNTKPFQGITLIEDAYTLHAKLRAEDGSTTFNPEMDEEFEDRTGNVMNRKVYTDLARQGLLDAA
jgi:hypothetical protein